MMVTVRHFGCAEYLAYYGYSQGGEIVFHEAAPREPVTVSKILEVVCGHYGVQVDDLRSPRQHRRIARPRQVAMYLCRHRALKTFAQIGMAFGRRDHTTVLHGCRKVESLIETDREFAGQVSAITRALSA